MIGLLTATSVDSRNHPAPSFAENLAGNSGNLIFDDALHALLPGSVSITRNELEEPEGLSHIVVSLANIVSSSPMTEGLRDLWMSLSRARAKNPNLRIVVTSLGCQYNSYLHAPTVDPERERFIREISEWAEFVGVRGFYSAEVLHSLGVGNTWVVGDPALLHPRISPVSHGPRSGVAVHWTPSGRYRDKNRELLRWGLRYSAAYIAQSDGEGFSPGDSSQLTALPSLAKILEYHLWPSTEFVAPVMGWLATEGRWFGSMREWIDFLRDKQLVIGTRYHGSAAAMIAGTPTLLLVHDSRTAEMSAFHGLPSMGFQDFDERAGVDSYLASTSREIFSSRLQILRANLWDFWHAVELDPAKGGSGPTSNVTFPRSTSNVSISSGGFVASGLRHALTSGGLGHLSNLQVKAIVSALTAPRDESTGGLIEWAPTILLAVQGSLPGDVLSEFRNWLGLAYTEDPAASMPGADSDG